MGKRSNAEFRKGVKRIADALGVTPARLMALGRGDEDLRLTEAAEADLKTAEDWNSKWHPAGGNNYDSIRLVVKRDVAPRAVVDGVELFSRDDCEETITKTRAKELGLLIPEGTEPLRTGYKHGREFNVYRLSDGVAKPERKAIPPEIIDILSAIFTVNRTAKRYRDKASKHYGRRQHGLAGHASHEKNRLYSLKDAGIQHAYQTRDIDYAGRHGGFALYRGNGYCFHSFNVPEAFSDDAGNVDTEAEFVAESKPKEAKEPKLKDAVYTLGNLPTEAVFSRPSKFVRIKTQRELEWEREEREAAVDLLDEDLDEYD